MNVSASRWAVPKGAVTRRTASKGVVAVSALSLLLGMPAAQAAALPTTVINDPPAAGHLVSVFPARDFVSSEGYRLDETYTVEVHHSPLRGGAVVSSRSGIVPDEQGLVEVNHPGGGCWAGVTPNIVAGDIILVIVDSSPDPTRIGVADQTPVADVTATRPTNPAPGTIVVRGTGKAVNGGPLPLGQLEARLVAPGNTFERSGRRDLRAPGATGASLQYDPVDSTNWTAIWTGLTDRDVTLALGAQSMGAWLGRNPAAANEGTIYETGAGIAGGPMAPCTAPKEKLPPLPGQDSVAPSVPQNLTATVTDVNTVTLKWDAAVDNEPNAGVTNYGVYRNGVPIFTVQKPDGSAPAPTTFVDNNVPPGTYEYSVDAADAIDNRSAESVPATAIPGAKPAPAVPVNEPPIHPIIAYPSRDMVDVDQVPLDHTVTIQLIRDGKLISDSPGLIPDSDGLAEVNHVGVGCWNGTTPDIRANDKVRAIAYHPDGSVAWIDQATVANVVAQKAVKVRDDDPNTEVFEGVIEIHGTAATHDGSPLPVDQIEQRLVSSSKRPFGKNGRRTIRADASGQLDGTLTYDPVNADTNPLGMAWTATYTGLDAADVKLATEVESRVMWLGRQPAANLELTIYEIGLADPPGPATPDCVAPLEPLDTAAPGTPGISATTRGADREVDLFWTEATDNVYVYGYRVFRDGTQVAATGAGKTTYTDRNVRPGAHTYSVEAFDSASPRGGGATGVENIATGLGKPYGNTSARSERKPVTMPDVQPPSVPGNLQVTNPTAGDPPQSTDKALLVFDPSTDDSGVVEGYRVYRDGEVIIQADPSRVNGRFEYTDSGLTTGQTYRYAVQAVDAAGNASARTPEVSATIALDTQAPVAPGNLTAQVPDVHGRDVVITWDAATDNIGATGYGVYRNGAKVAQVTARTYRDIGLATGTYEYTVDAVDSAGNRSPQGAASKAVIANDPPVAPHNVTAYPARDFVSGDGYAGQGPVRVEVIRNNVVVAHTQDIQPDPAGLVEVNHAGPGCWDVNTPDIRAGDVVRIITAAGVADQTTVQDVYAGRPIQTAPDTIVVHGTAADAAGKPLPIDQLEHRLVSRDRFTNGDRTLRAPASGTIAYEAAGSTEWTATYKGIGPVDVARSLASESLINWLGRSPLLNNELTIFENGPGTDGGPAAGVCTAPLEPGRPQASWTPTQLPFGDQSASPAPTSAPKRVMLSNAGASPLVVSDVYLGGASPGDFTVTPLSLPVTISPGSSVNVDVKFSPKAVGARSATVNFTTNASNTSFQTIDLTGNGTDSAAPAAPGRPAVTFGTASGGQLPGTNVPVTVTWAASATGTVTRYQVQRATSTGGFTDVAAQPGTGLSLTEQLAPGSYRYQVRACNGGSCSAWVATAAATILAAVQENDKALSYGGKWAVATVSGAFGGSVQYASTNQEKVLYKVTASGVQLISTTGPNRGRAEVWVNRTRVATIDLYSPAEQPRQVVWSREGMATNTPQDVEVRVLGTRNPASTGNRVDVDGFLSLR
ncbi:MAG: Fn3 associated [Dactylosporangium sp.]|nr:Fn3 associated [Dactylosporangium sp.]